MNSRYSLRVNNIHNHNRLMIQFNTFQQTTILHWEKLQKEINPQCICVAPPTTWVIWFLAHIVSSAKCKLFIDVLMQHGLCACLSVCLATQVSPAKLAKSIEMPLGDRFAMGPRNHTPDGGICGLHRCHLANTT